MRIIHRRIESLEVQPVISNDTKEAQEEYEYPLKDPKFGEKMEKEEFRIPLIGMHKYRVKVCMPKV